MNWIAPPDGQRCRLIMKAGKGQVQYGTWIAKYQVFAPADMDGDMAAYSNNAIAERDVEEWAKA